MSIAFIGPLPPPVHGFSAINQAMLDRLQQKCTVEVFNRAPPSNTGRKSGINIRKITSSLRLIGRFINSSGGRISSAYVGFSGGWGQLLDLPYFMVLHARGIPTFVHHHSFAYITRPSFLTRMCMRHLKHARHIALGPEMSRGIQETYDISPANMRVLSNSAFLPSLPSHIENGISTQRTANLVRAGFLSNITAEKGIFDFLDVLRTAQTNGLHVEGMIAGPVSADIKDRFIREVSEISGAMHLGPLYGEEKQNFFQKIDLLLFPTRYVNEAEPVTLHEALQAGVSVVAADRGCIRGMLPDYCGTVVPIESFQQEALHTLRQMALLTQQERQARRKIIKEYFQEAARRSETTLRSLLLEIISPKAER